MKEKTNRNQQWIFVFTILAVLVWVSASFINSFTAQANDSLNSAADCPATLMGAAIGDKQPGGNAQFRDKKNQLQVSVSSVNLPENTTLSVFVGDTSVGQIALSKNGKGKVTAATTMTIMGGMTISVKNGETMILSGRFACVNVNPALTVSPTTSPVPTMSPSPMESPTVEPTVMPTTSPTVEPTVMPTESPAVTPTVSPTEDPPTQSPTPTPTPTPTPSA